MNGTINKEKIKSGNHFMENQFSQVTYVEFVLAMFLADLLRGLTTRECPNESGASTSKNFQPPMLKFFTSSLPTCG